MKKKAKSSRKKSIITLSVAITLLVVALIFTFHSFSYGEDGVKEYKSVVGAIDKGIDIDGGFYAILEPMAVTQTEKDNLDKNIKEAVKIINKRLGIENYIGASAFEQESNGRKSIRIEIPKTSSIQSLNDADTAFNNIIKPAVLEFKFKGEDDIILDNSNLKSVAVVINSNGNYAVLKLTKDAKKKLTEKTQSNIGKTLEIYIDNETLASEEIKEALTSDPSFNMGSKEQAYNFAMQLNSGALPFTFQTNFESKEISPTLGQNVLKSILIASIIGICFIIILMLVIYKGFGITSALSLLIYIVLLLFIISQISSVQLTLSTIIGIMLSIGMAAGANITIFERIKEEYSLGKSLTTSLNNGFKRVTSGILDYSIVAFILAVMLLILGSGQIRSFAIVLTVGVFLSAVICFTVTKLLAKLLLPLSNKPKFYGLKRGVIKDED